MVGVEDHQTFNERSVPGSACVEPGTTLSGGQCRVCGPGKTPGMLGDDDPSVAMEMVMRHDRVPARTGGEERDERPQFLHDTVHGDVLSQQ